VIIEIKYRYDIFIVISVRSHDDKSRPQPTKTMGTSFVMNDAFSKRAPGVKRCTQRDAWTSRDGLPDGQRLLVLGSTMRGRRVMACLMGKGY
jgi:hypothetical protein